MTGNTTKSRISMTTSVIRTSLLLLLLQTLSASAATGHNETDSDGSVTKGFTVGFRVIEESDVSRVVSAGASDAKVFARPVRTWLWYPASNADKAEKLLFGRYAEFAADDVWPQEIVGKLRSELDFSTKVLARSLGPEKFRNLLKRPVNAIEAAKALEGPFPLIVIGQGLYYESPVTFYSLAEFLASQGFVVATSPLVGTNSPIVRMNVPDLETQVRDLEFVIGRARQESFVSPEKLGVFGFDMGGMAGLILTMRNADVDAFASVSSGILYEHPTGIPSSSPHYDPLALRVPWLHSMPAYWLKPPESKAISLFDTARHADRYLLLTENLGHVDYTSYALIPGRNAMAGYWGKSNPDITVEHNTVNKYVSHFFSAFLKDNEQSKNYLDLKPKEVAPSLNLAMEHRPAEPILITYEEFVQAIVAGKALQAVEKVRALRAVVPDHVLLNETYLERLVWSLGNTWGFYEKLMPVIKLRIELFPESDGAQHMLADAYVEMGNPESAKRIFEQLLVKNPEDQYVKYRLDSL